MKFLLLLLLLTSWTHLGSEARACDTGMSINGHLVSIDGSRLAGADAYFIKAYHSDKLETCLDDCCSSKFGTCSVAAYKNKTESTCLHFFCEPLSKCKFFPTDFADSFAFPHAVTSTIHDKLEDLVTPITDIVTLLKNHERSVAARKGVETIPSTRKGVDLTKEDRILDGELTFKDDNTTIKPRKGVDFFSYTSTTPLSNISVIKPRKGVDMDQVDIHDLRSKIKPRKGVESFTTSSTSLMPSSSPFTTKATPVSQHSLTLHSNDDDELISILKNIFTDDTNVTEVPDRSSTDTITAQVTSIAASSSATLHTNDQYFTTFPTTINSSPSLSTVPHTTSVFGSNDEEDNMTSYVEFTSTPNLYPSLPHDQNTNQYSSILSTSALTDASTRNIIPTTIHSRFPIPSSLPPTVMQSTVYLSSSQIPEVLSEDQGNPSQSTIDENNRKYQSSMHLVFALVFGLLVLFGVLGTIAKRVYDSWVRRHYRRMDFLIDGMYDGYP